VHPKQLIFLRGARQLLTLRGPSPRRGLQLSDLGLIRDGSVLVEGDKIVEVGSTRRIENLARSRKARVVEVGGKVLLPGFVDPHMRLLFGGPPLRSFEQWIAGAPVEREPAEGAFSAIRFDTLKSLRSMARRWTYLAAAYGSTTLELRSSQGLHIEAELRALRVARALDGDPLELSAVFSATLPAGMEQAEGVERTLQVMERLAARRGLCEAVEVRCDPGGFRESAARAILRRALQLGFERRLVVDARSPGGRAGIAVDLGVRTAERLDAVLEGDIDRLADSAAIAMLLPAISCDQALAYPPGRRLIDRGAAVALATGFGPAESPGFGMQTAISLACREMRFMPEEAIAAATINAAEAIGRASRIGSIEPDKQADLTVFDVEDYREIPYFFGVNLCALTMKRGRIIYRAATPPALDAGTERRPEPEGSRA
jgi:imidazolonepropionase